MENRNNSGALFAPTFAELSRYGDIYIENDPAKFAIIKVKTKTGKTVYELFERVGAMHINQKKRPDKKDPDVFGTFRHANIDYRISGWAKTSQTGSDFTSVSIALDQLGKSEQEEDVPF